MDVFKTPSLLPKKVQKVLQSTSSEDEISQLSAQCPYKEPEWSGCASQDLQYKFEILKMGQIIDEIKDLQKRPFWVFGRLPENHIEMAHPTVSRFHAVLQYRPKSNSDEDENEATNQIDEGWYIYDMGSTHGTFLNKLRIPAKVYIRIKVGHILRLGASSRNFIFMGPESDEEPESEMSVTELKEMRANAEELKRKNEEMQMEAKEKEGIDWGMAEDADEETDLSINPYATTNNEELFLDDPKKTLRGFFEREGLDLEYKCDEMSVGTFVCRVELPVDDANGKQIVAEVCHKGKKKECVLQCALEACRILDRHGVLRQANHEPLKRKIQTANSDDEDDFFDRTGDVERKRMRKAASSTTAALTYDDLIQQEAQILEKIKIVEDKIVDYQELAKRVKESKDRQDDDLDAFMENLTDEAGALDKIDIRKLRIEEKQLRGDYEKVKKLIQIAKPLDLPPISNSTVANTEPMKRHRKLPMIGKRNQFSFKTLRPLRTVETRPPVEKELKSDEEEVEDDEEQQKPTTESAAVVASSPKEPIEEDTKQALKESPPTETTKVVKLYGPALIPEDVKSKLELKDPELDSIGLETQKIDNADINEEEIDKPDCEESEREISAKKKRQRNRARGRRVNVDIDDSGEQEDTEKYSKWVPPANQTGDGITSLNDKFGY